MNKKIAVKIVNVSKKYTVHHEKPTLVEKLLNGEVEEFWALKNINLVINRGERVGIVGLNGCGKTTLLKIISGITSPTKGHVQIYGNVVSLIDLEAGFHTDLSGYANVFINGMLLGMSKSEINQKINGFYSSIQPFTNGKTVREWIKDKSFEEQYKFGAEIMERFMK